jgi:hypothetical protein
MYFFTEITKGGQSMHWFICVLHCKFHPGTNEQLVTHSAGLAKEGNGLVHSSPNSSDVTFTQSA